MRLILPSSSPLAQRRGCLLAAVVFLLAAGCSGESATTGGDPGEAADTAAVDAAPDAGTVDAAAVDTAGTVGPDAVQPADAGPNDTAAPGDAAGASDTAGPGDATGPNDASGAGDAAGVQDAGGGGTDTGAIVTEVATLEVQDQTLTTAFDQVIVQKVALAANANKAGKLRVFLEDDGKPGAKLAEVLVAVGEGKTDLPVKLSAILVGQKNLMADLLQADGTPFLTVDGSPLVVAFQVTGDGTEPQLVMPKQQLAANDLYSLNAAYVRVPDAFKEGVWVAVYADKDGAPDKLLGKKSFKPGEHKDTVLATTSKVTRYQLMHAVMRRGVSGSGSWNANGEVVTDLAGAPVGTSFLVDSVAFHPVLEIEDQTLTNPKELKIKLVTVPQEHFGGWLAVHADKDGKEGDLLGKLYFTKGTKENATLKFTAAQQGDKTMHAVLYAGQMWDENNNKVMVSPFGSEMKVTFKVGAQSLSYIEAKPYTTDDPRHVVVTRAYSFNKPAWVVLARDDNGKPGTVLARKKVLKKFAGNVHLHDLYGDFLFAGGSADFLQGKDGTYRRCVRGDEKLHVMLYEDDPPDGKFTWTPGGSEDVPVLDANQQPVTALLDVSVKASVDNSQKDSARYYFPCPLSQHVANPTVLPVDCRCHVNIVGLDFPECKSSIADSLSMSFGEGPRAKTLNFGVFRSGFAEPASNELIALVEWKDNKTVWPENKITINVGAVMAIDATTRKRRLIGGRYDDPVKGIIDIGKGPVLSYPFEAQKGPDGKYYIASYSYVRIGASLTPGVDIIRMDPKTGDREYVWRSNHLGYNFDNKPNPYGHCANGRTAKYGYYSVQIGRKAFGIDDKGNFYLSYAHNGNTPESDGIGIIQVSSDGGKCGFVTRTKVGANNVLYKGQAIGKGPEPQAGPYKGMLVKDGKLYVSTQLNDALWQIDIATGDRKPLHTEGVDDNNTGSSGTHVVWDPYRKLIWQAGLSSATLLYDPATGKSEPLWCPQNDRDFKGIACKKMGAWGNNGLLLERGLWMHPSDQKFMFVVNGPMIQRVHLKSGTSEIFSY